MHVSLGLALRVFKTKHTFNGVFFVYLRGLKLASKQHNSVEGQIGNALKIVI